MASLLTPDHYPLSPLPLTPSHAFYISHLHKPKHTTNILNLTASLPILFSLGKGPNLASAHKLAMLTEPAPPIAYTMKKENLFGTHLVAKDSEGKEVAEWKSPFLSFSFGGPTATKIKFLGEMEGDKKTEVNVKLAGTGMRAESFVKDGITYIWELEPHAHEHKVLYQVIDTPDGEESTKQKRVIADFTQPGPHHYDGLLVLDANEIDDLTAIITLCAVLEGPAREARPDAVGDMAFLGMVG